MTRTIAFLLPYGGRDAGFFPDALAGILCARAREVGHRAQIFAAHYGGGPPPIAEAIADADLIVVERLFDPEPLRGRPVLYVTQGEEVGVAAGVASWVIGLSCAPTRAGHRRTPEIGELAASFDAFLARWANGDPASAPGVSTVEDGRLVHRTPSSPAPLPRPFRAAVDVRILGGGAPRRIKTVYGNAGCPYASDPLEAPHYANVRLPLHAARLGCAFCSMGGDYQKRPDAIVVEETIEQARFYAEHVPDLEALVLSDQHALRYLAAAMDAARGLPPLRWLFAARADSFVRERDRVERAIDRARAAGQRLEVYLSGFEAFCDRELARYHKGATKADLLAAVRAMRELARAHPDAFDHARARGHSLILFNPWTSPDDVGESVETMRAHGLAELFDEVGKNRLRLYDGLPITAAAERDGALADWDEAGEGAARAKGYPAERPWRFLDPRTAVLRRTTEQLRARLGTTTELAQLAAAVAFSKQHGELDARALDRLCDALAARAGGAHRAACVVRFAGACNDGCPSCPNRDRHLPDDAALARVDEARASGLPIALAGREPTIHPAFADILARASDRELSVVTNGRRFAYAPFTTAVAKHLSAASVKIFAPDAERADAIARADGAHAQAIAGARLIARAGVLLEVRAPLHASTIADLPTYAALARELGARSVFVECAIDALGLENLERAALAVRDLCAACDALGLAIETAPLEAGALRFDRLPTGTRGAISRGS